MISVSCLFELNKAGRMIAAGKISKHGINRLKRSGSIPSKERYMAGIDKGSDAMIKKYGLKEKSLKSLSRLMGPHAKPERPSVGELKQAISKGTAIRPKQTINMPKNDPTAFRLLSRLKGNKITKKGFENDRPIYRRHEVDEAKSMKKQTNSMVPVNHATMFTKKDKKGKSKLVGMHAGPQILKNEKKITDYTTKAYGTGKELSDLRKKTGEYDLVDKLSPKKIKDINKKSKQHRLNTISAKFIDDAKNKASKEKGLFKKAKTFVGSLKKGALPYQVGVDER